MEPVILAIDSNVLFMKSVFVSHRLKQKSISLPFEYFYLKTLFSVVKKFDTEKVFICQDDKISWRKEVLKSYKSLRKQFRQKFDIDWDILFKRYDLLLKRIDRSTNFFVIKIPKLEADDLISGLVQYFRPKTVVIVSVDSDLKQLLYFNNAKYYSLKAKKLLEIKNPVKVLLDKINKGDVADCIKGAKSLEEFKVAEQIINLINLPQWVIKKCFNLFRTLPHSKKCGRVALYKYYNFKFLKGGNYEGNFTKN